MIFVVGSVNLDQVGKVDRLPRHGETVAGRSYSTVAGGKGANQALAARRAGSEVALCAAVGSDISAELALAAIRDAEVGMQHVKIGDTITGIAMIVVDDTGENTIVVIAGANANLCRADVDTALATASAGDIVLLQQEIPQDTTARALEIARQRGLTTVLNVAPLLSTTADVASQADIVVANENEFAMLYGHADDFDSALLEVSSRHAQTIVVTLGAHGVKAASNGDLIHVPALRIRPVDTVGAGDTFCGYLAAGLDAGHDLTASMLRAARAASLACLTVGAQPAIPTSADVDRAEVN